MCLLKIKPFDRITIREITLSAGVGYATFFRRYGGTHDLLTEIAEAEISDLFKMAIPVMEQADSAASCQTLCQYVFDNRPLWHTLLAGGAAALMRAEFVRQARQYVAETETPSSCSMPIDLSTTCSAGSTIDALAWWLQYGHQFSVDEIAAWINHMLILPHDDTARPRQPSAR